MNIFLGLGHAFIAFPTGNQATKKKIPFKKSWSNSTQNKTRLKVLKVAKDVS